MTHNVHTRTGQYIPARSLVQIADLYKGKVPVQHEKGRVCVESGCITVLTRYNPDDYCYLHSNLPFVNRSNGKGHRTAYHSNGHKPKTSPLQTLIGEVGL